MKASAECPGRVAYGGRAARAWDALREATPLSAVRRPTTSSRSPAGARVTQRGSWGAYGASTPTVTTTSTPAARAGLKAGKIRTDEGIVLGGDIITEVDGEKITKPDDIIRDYGADAARLYVMYMGPLEAQKPWNTRDIIGIAAATERYAGHRRLGGFGVVCVL